MKYEHTYEILEGLQPEMFFFWFGEVSAIPRASGNEAGMIAFLQNYAAKRNLTCDVDAAGNVLIRVPATKGYEDQPMLLLQGHMDMVPVVDPGVDFDFGKDPINLIVDGDRLYAPGTTLGADNGVGLATMLAVADTLAEEPISHPPLELLFTVEEETGLIGIRKFDCSKLKSRRMITFDSGNSHCIVVSLGGRNSAKIKKTYTMEPLPHAWNKIQINLTGGLGGHSGGMINKNRACAANNMGELLIALLRNTKIPSLRICSLKSSEPSIIKKCSGIVAVPSASVQEGMRCIEERFNALKELFKTSDPDLELSLTMVPEDGEKSFALSEEDSANIAKSLALFHTGVYRVNHMHLESAITGSSVNRVELTEAGTFEMDYSIRSANDTDKALLFEKYTILADLLDMELKSYDDFSGWPEKEDSLLQEKIKNIHRNLFAEEIQVRRGIGSVEVGIIMGNVPDMDAVAYAPTSTGAHTTSEHLLISQVNPFWDVLKMMLEEK